MMDARENLSYNNVTDGRASISLSMWKIWVDISDSKATACEERALSCLGMLKKPQVMANAFRIDVYDHHKCTSLVIKIHAKQDVLT